ncbi:hypothetical protein Cgig2_020691 [Carnegiea gigantea]|uniref:Transposase MuDR plant domain-containing protein n=1 Tax=Carnegiea gigantea TaxID=171969 RepID=A0A9Q1GWA9_9CARY|nr:hypothetical protein Cgig2_020691 [Carnegiea gigantea]
MVSIRGPTEHHLIEQELESGQVGESGIHGLEGISCGEYDTILSASQTQKWVDSLIITPESQQKKLPVRRKTNLGLNKAASPSKVVLACSNSPSRQLRSSSQLPQAAPTQLKPAQPNCPAKHQRSTYYILKSPSKQQQIGVVSPTLSADMSECISLLSQQPSSSQPSCSLPLNTSSNTKSSQPTLQSLEDINIDPNLTIGLDDKNEEESGNDEDSDDDVGSEVGSNVASENGSKYSDESFVNSDEVHVDDVDSDIDQFLHPTLQDDIPKHIGVDDDGSMWNKVYQNGSMWIRDLNGKVSIKPGDIFLDKEQWVKVLRDYTIQEGICLKKVKNDKLRHIVVCKGKDCEFRVHTSRLGDGKTWQVKTFRSVCKCARDAHNNMASYKWIAEQLMPDFKANPDLQVNSMIQLCMERYGLVAPDYKCRSAKKLMKAWVDGRHDESYARLPEYIEQIKKENPGTLQDIFPECRRRICCAHYNRNFTKAHPACNAYNKQVFQQTMEAIKKESKEAYEWLCAEEEELWARYKFQADTKCPDNTTNFVESFNGKIGKFRYKPVWTLLEAIRKKFMSTIVRKFEITNGWSGKLCPRVTIQLKETEIAGRMCIIIPAGRGLFEVVEGNTHFKVDLNSGCCDCRVWDISGIPCKYAIRCILRDRQDPESYVHDAYTVEKYRAAYDVIMKPVTDPIFWEDSDCPRLGPPEIEVKRGRPPSERRRDGTEKRKSFSRSSTLRCSVCKQYGHNSRSHREGGKLSIWRGKDKPSYKSKTGSTRKVGRPPKHPSQPSNDATSQPSISQSKKGKKRKASICGTSVVKKARKGKASL